MHKGDTFTRLDISDPSTWPTLRTRNRPYYKILSYGRHIGVHRTEAGYFWVARYRTRLECYRQRRLGVVAGTSIANEGCDFEEAVRLAKQWFAEARVRALAADDYPIGVRRELAICPIGEVFTVGHALHDYVEWKRLVAAKSHFETNLSLINFHIVPRLASLPARDLNGEVLRAFVQSVLETPPKRGNQALGPSRALDTLDEEALRKRKKTVNTLIGVLRVSLKMAWENGKHDSDRAWRSLRRIPHVDRPRILHLSRAESRDLLAVCRPDLQRLVLGALYTGCRATELVRMRCSQVGRDGYGVYIAPLKNYRPRFVFLPDEGMAWFLDLISGRKPSDLVFVRDSGKPWFGNHRHLFKAAVREASLPDDFTFHGLRHTYASQLIQAGATVFVVADQLGHGDPTTVLRTYGHLSPQIRESEVRQRFSPVSIDNFQRAQVRNAELLAWRSSLHGADWRSYAQISDLASVRHTTDGSAP